MSIPSGHAGEDEVEGEEVFLDEDDIIQEIPIDEEDLPDQDEDGDFEDDGEEEEADDSIFSFSTHTDELYAVAFNPVNPIEVATGGKDDRGFLWRIGQVDSPFELTGHRDTVSTTAFSSDGQLLASGSFDGQIQIWDTNSRSLKCTLEGSGEGFEWLRWHPNGHVLIAGSEDCNVWMWNPDKNVCRTFSGHGGNVTCGDFTPDGKYICSGSDDASLRLWNPKTGESIQVVKGHPYHTDGLTCLSIFKDASSSSPATLAISCSKDSSVCVVNLTAGRVVASLAGHTSSVECVSVSPSSLYAATGGMDQKMIIWDLNRSSQRCVCEHEEGVTCLTWIGTSKYIATGCIDGKVRVWDSLSGHLVRTFGGHTDTVQSLAVSPALNCLVSVSSDHTAKVFDITEFN